ncbi:MAG TPA: ATP-binding cassette domain-containing protein [bacterium]|nr:ATP-binding cassette domain-containing protein [bacterium]
MIDVENLTKSYGPVEAVKGISFHVDAGEIVGFLGKNGAGKTTTMRMLTGFLPPTDGAVRIAGHDVFEESLEARRVIGYLPETPPLYPEMTVAEYLSFVAELKDVPRATRAARVDDVIGRLSLGDMRGRLIGHLSKGYRQRVGLAQALVHEPKVLILDEPTVGLDPVQILEIQDVITGLAKDRTVILSTHILEQVEAICRTTIVIRQGTIVFRGSIDEFRSMAATRRALHVMVKGPKDAVEKALKLAIGSGTLEYVDSRDGNCSFNVSAPEGQDVREPIFRAVVNGGWVLMELAPRGSGLAEVFAELTKSTDAPGPAKELAA